MKMRKRLSALLLGLTADGFFGKEEAVEHGIKAQLLFPASGINRAESSFHQLPIRHAQGNEHLGGVGSFLWAHVQPFQPQQPGKGGELFQINSGLNHGDAPGNGRSGFPL